MAQTDTSHLSIDDLLNQLPYSPIELPPTPSKSEIESLLQCFFDENQQHFSSFRQFTDGITNRLYKISFSGGAENILIRVYGEKTELLIDREKELKCLLTLHKAGLAPPLYGRFTNGICYGFFTGTTFSVSNMQDADKFPKVAQELALFHSVNVEGVPTEPSLLRTLRNWADLVGKDDLQDSLTEDDIIDGGFSYDMFTNLLNKLEQQISMFQESKIVFCHNDLLSANILFSPPDVKFIDYEYGSFNYNSFDIGNHFCEMMGFDVDYEMFPSNELQVAWLGHYITESNKLSKQPELSPEQLNQTVRGLHEEVKLMVLAANLYWGVWALVQHKFSTVDFDYQAYSHRKLRAFYHFKSIFKGLL